MTSRRKQEENHLKILKDLLAQPSNKKCLECDQRGPTYVDVTIGSFVCTSCGGILRGLNPPHRVKSISMTTFTVAEISFMESRGNEWCRAVYLAKYDEQSRAKPESRTDQAKLKHFMEMKYEQKRWYESPSRQRKLMENAAAAKKSKETTTPAVQPLKSLLGENVSGVQIPSANKTVSHEIRARKDVKPSSDLLGSLSAHTGASISSPNFQTSTSSAKSSNAFADFDSAFGPFTTPAVSAPSSQNAFANFGEIPSQPMAFTHGTNGQMATSDKKGSSAGSGGDKYAALADLDLVFHKNEPQSTGQTMNDFSWSSPARSTQSNLLVQPAQPNYLQSSPPNLMQQQTLIQPSQPVQPNLLHSTQPSSGFLVQPQQGSSFPAAPASAAPQSWSSMHSNWNTGFQKQPVVQQNAATNNPFFNLPSTVNAAPGNPHTEYGAWTQPQQQPPLVPMNNPAGMSSTNPFSMGVAPSQTNYFQQTQNVKPISNPSNPFMF